MKPILLLLAVLLPMSAGVLLCIIKLKTDRAIKAFTAVATLSTSALTWALILHCPNESITLLHFAERLAVVFRFDALGRFFAGILATLWPITVLYAFSYMEHEQRRQSFFGFFTICFGVALGISMSGNLFTMYIFYELLTLATTPLVIHTLTKKAVNAAKTYLVFSLGGAAFVFAAMIFLISNGAYGEFHFGGLLTRYPYDNANITQIFYLLGFLGFGVKAAIFPLHVWLPRASVAPTPVTALLHAVAVVKAGVFAVMRLTYFSFGTALLKGGWVQSVVMSVAIFTILFGASKAVREPHWKRRLVYSTVANLSYILFGVTMMTEAGFTAALMHMAFHACVKILAFFCAGAVLCRTGRELVTQLDGLGRRMPRSFAAFTVAALALTGIPPLNCFVSKWQLLTAAADSENPLAYVGAGVLLLAALLTAIYMLSTVRRAWFPSKETDLSALEGIRDADWRMVVPFVILSLGVLLTGLFATPILHAAQQIAQGR
ncbi:MAG: proton-conducting membrane transporter [Oscillospiraceae bacterium]|nr:proton-conducting membrane transporter [Oscillospiraceae bacterium]